MALKLQLVCEIEYELIYKKKNHTLGNNIYEPSLLETVSWGFITSGNSGGVEWGAITTGSNSPSETQG